MSEGINSQFDFFKKVNLDEEGNIGVSLVGDVSSPNPFSFYAENYTELLTKTGMLIGNVAYVKSSEGSAWLPNTLGGTYYPKGLYLYNGTSWVSDRNAISYELYLDDNRLDSLEGRLELTDGNKGDITVSNLGATFEINAPEVTQSEAENGTSTEVKKWTPQRVLQAISFNSSKNYRVVSNSSLANLIIDSSETDQSVILSQSQSLTINAPIGTPVDGRKLIIRIKDNGTARALTWNTIFEVIGVTLPTTTTANKTIYVGLIYNSQTSKWNVLAVKEQI